MDASLLGLIVVYMRSIPSRFAYSMSVARARDHVIQEEEVEVP